MLETAWTHKMERAELCPSLKSWIGKPV